MIEDIKQILGMIVPEIENYINEQISKMYSEIKKIYETVNRHEALITQLNARLINIESTTNEIVIRNLIKSSIEASIEFAQSRLVETMKETFSTLPQILDNTMRNITEKIMREHVDKMLNELGKRVGDLVETINRNMAMLDQAIEKMIVISREVTKLCDTFTKMTSKITEIEDKIRKIAEALETLGGEEEGNE